MKKISQKEPAKRRKKKSSKAKKSAKKRRPENASLIPRYISKIKQEYLDYDYLSQLNDKEKKWLADFTAEWLNAEVPSQKNAKQSKFAKSKKQVKKITDMNNQRQRCATSQMRAQGRLMYLSNENMSDIFDSKKNNKFNETENNLVKLIDIEKNKTDLDLINELSDRKSVLKKMICGEITTRIDISSLIIELEQVELELTNLSHSLDSFED